MEFIKEYISDSEQPETEPTISACRTVYLVTYSQANTEEFPTRLYFASVLANSFAHVGAEVIQWCCSQEKHQDGGIHYHVALKLKKLCRWKGSKDYLKQRYGITVNYSGHHPNYYSAWRYVTKTDAIYVQSENHPDLSNATEPKTTKASKKRIEKGCQKRARRQRERGTKGKKRKKLTPLQVSEVMLTKELRTSTELYALAYEQKKEGKDDLMEFLVGRSRKAVSELIDTTWEIKEAGQKLERARQTRIEILNEARTRNCVTGCNGQWLKCAKEVLRNNNIPQDSFSQAIKTLLEEGRGKYKNIMITGPANCGKTFMLKPLTEIYHTFCNPATGSFAWVGVDEKECIFLNDFRWNPQIIPWSDLLLMLEGEVVHLPAPKTHFSHDMQLVGDTPIFCTTKRPLLYIKGGVVDDRETEMMAVRWKMFEFKAQIPEARQRNIKACPKCFADMLI